MKELLKYLDESTLAQLQYAFSAVAEREVVICDADQAPIIPGESIFADWQFALDCAIDSPADYDPQGKAGVPVMLDGVLRGMVKFSDSSKPVSAMQGNLLKLMSQTIARMCDDADQLRNRIDQLLAVHKVNATLTAGQTVNQVLDTIAKTAGEVIGAKSSTIRMFGKQRDQLHIKAGYNVSEEYLLKGAILLSDSLIDQEAVSTQKPVYMEDMGSDPRVLYQQEALMEGFVSGLCVPMVYDNRCEGLLRIYMDDFYSFDWFEFQLAQTIANSGAAAIAHARDAEEAHLSSRMKKQLTLAAEVQRRLIPSEPPEIPGYDIAYEFVPTYELGGDFFDFIQLPSGKLAFVVCDVVGKGVRASLLMASVRASLRAHSAYLDTMSKVIAAVNRDLCADTKPSDFATMFFGLLDPASRKLAYVCAGHPPAMLARKNQIIQLEAGGGVLGILPEMPYQAGHVKLQSQDRLIVFTDGLNEAVNFQYEQYGRNRIAEALTHCTGQGFSAQNTVRYCLWDMRRFAGLRSRMDDTTILGIVVE